MNIAVLSDIHGNYEALKACITYALEREITTFVFLGDYLGEFAYPRRTMEYLYRLRDKYECYFIRGNKEDYWLNYRSTGESGWNGGNSITGTLWYTYQNITEKDLDFFTGMEISKTFTPGEAGPITLCHGSPFSNKEALLPEKPDTRHILEQSSTRLILCGHTHIQQKIEHPGRTALNPGSVGAPVGVCRKAQFMLLHQNEDLWEEEFLSLDYPVEKEIENLYNAKLDRIAPYWCKSTICLLQTGIDFQKLLLQKAMELCRKERGECIWPDIPEKYCAQAYEFLIKQNGLI